MGTRRAAVGQIRFSAMRARRRICVITAILLGCGTGVRSTSPASEAPADARTTSPPGRVELALRAESLAELITPGELFRELPDPAGLGVDRIIAFEDNPTFLYLCGISARDAARCRAGRVKPRRAAHVRRVMLFKPSVVVVDDQVRAGGPSRVTWALESKRPLGLNEKGISGTVGEQRFFCRTLLPGTEQRSVSRPDVSGTPAGHRIDCVAETTSGTLRLLHLVCFDRHGAPVMPGFTVRRDGRTLHLELSQRDDLLARDRTVQLSLPEDKFSAAVGVFDREGDGFLDLPTRPLAAGILPMGEIGYRMLQGWDIPYRDLSQGLAVWDTGRPSSQLKKVVEAGDVGPGRAVELGCGTGTDAVYLAGKGFDVTAIDIAPTALRLAEEKADKAGVKVRWLLADVLRPPDLEPFDFVYDRGCYHAIRRDFPRQYVAAVRRLTRPGSRVLILAGSANKDSYWRFAGPPRVKEEDIRDDFAEGFKLVWLREFRFDPVPPETQGALAWSVLLERLKDEVKAAPGGER